MIAGVALAGIVELFGWALPSTAGQLVANPGIGPGPGATIACLAVAAGLLAVGALANWLVWVGAQRPVPQ